MKIQWDDLFACIVDLLNSAGESPEGAKITAEAFCLADSRGITTHGSYLLTPIFERVKVNQLSLPTRAKVIQDSGAVAVIDGGDGLGPVAGDLAAELSIRRAKQYGLSLALIRNTNSLGSLAFYTEKIARQGMIALMGCNAAPAMAPWGGAEPFTGTNPIGIGVYTGKDYIFSADMASSIAARGKIRKAAREGKSIPPDWALDAEGNTTTDPLEALKGTLLPIGGPKGSALALTVDIFAGILAGSSFAPNVRSFHATEGPTGVGAVLMAMDIKKVMDLDEFSRTMDQYFASIKGMKKAKFASEIYLPGEIEYNRGAASKETGIDLEDKAVGVLNTLLEQTGSKRRLFS